ncbi:MAG TPA: hypothetical protein VEQ40_00225 [Pyrinomonadaceae bacterium]|nr:hypothetical protein [Pyrinomonadaceae bacterium]
MRVLSQPVTIENIVRTHRARRSEIKARLAEFRRVWAERSDARLWEELAAALQSRHRYPNSRSGYIAVTREHLRADCGMRLYERLEGFRDPLARRDWLARERGIKGLGYKESSHFLRNVGFSGYGILDKHILRSLAELQVIETPQPPTTRTRYLETEERLKRFARDIRIDFDELDLVLWSMKTGEILK